MMPLLRDEETRQFPETRPDSEAETHRAACECDVCKRPGSIEWKRKYVQRVRKQGAELFVTPAMPARGRRPKSHRPPTDGTAARSN